MCRGEGVQKRMIIIIKNDLLEQIWKEEEIPEKQCVGSNILYKKGDQTGNYRGISLLCTACKICVENLRKRLEEEKWKEMI